MAGPSNSEYKEELAVRVPKQQPTVAPSSSSSSPPKDRKFSVLKFNVGSDVDVTQWTSENVSLAREDNESTYLRPDSQPKSGVGSEFGRQLREEARRKKMGFATTRYSKDRQPWVLTLNPGSEKGSKRYRGIKEGGVSQNADYWVFVRGGDGFLDAHPVDEWYNFMPIGRYRTLDAEEAEEKFSRRNNILNQFALKVRQQLGTADLESEKIPAVKKREDDDDDPTKAKKQKETKTTDNNRENNKKRANNNKAKKNKKLKKERKMKEGEEGENFIASADSDDGDEEGREVDYMSDSDLSASSEEETEDVKVRQALVGVDEEQGMKKETLLMDSDDEDGDEEGGGQNGDSNTSRQNDDDENSRGEKMKNFDQMAKLNSITTIGADGADNDSDSGSDSDDPDKNMKAPFFMQELKPLSDRVDVVIAAKDKTEISKDTGSPFGKRKNIDEYGGASSSAKKTKIEKEINEPVVMNEEEVRRYLQRKPHSSKELVARFKPRCPGMSKAEMVKLLAEILKVLQPDQVERNGVMYFTLKK